jgi:hypothetical protein
MQLQLLTASSSEGYRVDVANDFKFKFGAKGTNHCLRRRPMK